jgi:hypothetical protein
MTPQQGGNASNKRTVFPEISTTVSLANKEAAVLYANELRKLFVPEDIWPLTTITIQEESEGYFAIRVTTAYSDT